MSGFFCTDIFMKAIKTSPSRISKKNTTACDMRFPMVDVLRGIAISAMFFYHFCFDLNYFGWIEVNFYQSVFWLALRAAIVTLFLSLVGVSLVLANRNQSRLWRDRIPRLSRLLFCAALVSAASYAIFPQSGIFFGVLHFILLASVLGQCALAFSDRMLLILGVVSLSMGLVVQHPFFDQFAWQWLGLMTYKPITEDYVPLLPWFAVVVLGMIWARRDRGFLCLDYPLHGVGKYLAWMGRHSLLLYMLHQPIFMGCLWLIGTSRH